MVSGSRETRNLLLRLTKGARKRGGESEEEGEDPGFKVNGGRGARASVQRLCSAITESSFVVGLHLPCVRVNECGLMG